jgi:hypothetical protein
MPIKKSNKIIGIVFTVSVLLLLTQNACVHASWASHCIRPGMSVQEALHVSGDWTWANAHSERPAPEPAVDLPFNRRLIFHGQDQRQQFASLEEVAQALDQQMTGHPWRMSLTYVGGIPRSSFAVYFDSQGRVQSISGISLAD